MKKQPHYDRLNLEESECHVTEQFNNMKAVKGAFQFGLCVLVVVVCLYPFFKEVEILWVR